MPRQIEFLIETHEGAQLMAVIDYELSQTIFENKRAGVGAIINDAEIDSMCFYKENGLTTFYNPDHAQMNNIKKRILDYHDDLKSKLMEAYEIPK